MYTDGPNGLMRSSGLCQLSEKHVQCPSQSNEGSEDTVNMQAMPASRASGQHAWTRSKATEWTLARLSQLHLQSGLARVSGLTRAQLPRSPDLELLASDF